MINNILIHDPSGLYMRLIYLKFPEFNNIFYSNDMESLHNIDYKNFALLIIFINSTDDLLDFAFLNSLNTKKMVGCGCTSIYKKLLFFPEIDLFNLIAPKKDLIKLLYNNIYRI
jgi:hypothetical protein